MLKKFFISMLGSMAAIWLSFGILFFGGLFTAGILIAKSAASSGGSGPDKILYLNLKGAIPEVTGATSFMELVQNFDSEADDLSSILTALTLAKEDKNIKGLYIDCNTSEAGIASRAEIIEAIKNFKESGKWVYAYADNYEQGDYYIASTADKVYLNPVGMLRVHGLTSQVMFFKDIMEKVGVSVDVVKVGTYKSAVEPYIRMEMSEPSRRQTEIFLDQIWGDITKTIAENRGVKPANVNMWADSLSMTWAPERYVEAKAVTELRYRSEVEAMLRDEMSLDADKDLPFITPTEYVALKTDKLGNPDKSHIAVLYAVGDIVDDGDGGIVASEMVPEIEALARDKNVAALVLRVNSGGGSAFASEQIWKALEDFKATGKPFFVSMGDYAASGGYYISCGADSIFADASTLTGSIGIFGIIPNASVLIKDKIGLGISTVSTNPEADFPNIVDPLTTKQREGMQAYIDRGYETFTSRVAEGRHLPIDSVKVIGEGRVWDGATALKIGLVDEIGGLDRTVQAMNELLNDDLKTVTYPKTELGLLETIIKQSRQGISVEIEGWGNIDVVELQKFARRVLNLEPLQARMEMIKVE